MGKKFHLEEKNYNFLTIPKEVLTLESISGKFITG